MAAATINLTVDQGSSKTILFTISADGSPQNLTGFDARLQVRRTYGDTRAELNCTLQNSKLQITDALAGKISLVLSPSDTSSIRMTNKDDDQLEAVYDLELVSAAGQVTKPVRGTFTLIREVTR